MLLHFLLAGTCSPPLTIPTITNTLSCERNVHRSESELLLLLLRIEAMGSSSSPMQNCGFEYFFMVPDTEHIDRRVGSLDSRERSIISILIEHRQPQIEPPLPPSYIVFVTNFKFLPMPMIDTCMASSVSSCRIGFATQS